LSERNNLLNHTRLPIFEIQGNFRSLNVQKQHSLVVFNCTCSWLWSKGTYTQNASV